MHDKCSRHNSNDHSPSDDMNSDSVPGPELPIDDTVPAIDTEPVELSLVDDILSDDILDAINDRLRQGRARLRRTSIV